MKANRRQFMLGTLGMALAAKLESAAALGEPMATSAKANQHPPYGSSHFGRWTEDDYGLPAFAYTCNQTVDRLAATAIKPGILGPTEHIHQVGNDRITALASNFGHVRVRQDEGNPKLLNDFDPDSSQFGGGIGYLTDGQEILSTYYDGNNPNFERIFGVGYYRKRVGGKSYSVDQVISAPFGDDPVLLSQVTITNRRSVPATVRWVEYWGCQPYQLSFRDFIEAAVAKATEDELRHRLGRRFSHQISVIEGKQGLLERKRFPGRPAEEEARWQAIKAHSKTHPGPFISTVQDEKPGTYLDSGDVPSTFLVSLDAQCSGFSSNAEAFFGSGGVANPNGIKSPLGNSPESSLADNGPHAGLLVERTVELAAKAKKTLNFIYGYLPEGFKLEALIAKYQAAPAAALERSSAEWKQRGMRFEVAAEPWVKREAAWNNYYLRSSQTYDDFFGEHILNQNGLYQYVMGFQGAARDPLQHCLPFLFSDPEIVRSILRYTLKEVRDDGSLPYGIVGHGVIAPIVTDNASDLPLWLLWTASEYILATRDKDILNQQIPARFSATEGRTDTVRNLLARCYRHQVNDVGTGRHGIVRMLNDDWNDGLVATWSQSAFNECVEQGESVLNSAMSAWVFDEYARMLRYAGESTALASQVSQSAETARKGAREQWTGKWLKRAWLGPTLGWLGETTLWIEPQPWAIVAGVTSPAESRELVATMNTMLRNGPIGAAQMSEGPDLTRSGLFAPGTCVRGGVWTSLNQTLIWALAQIDPAMAWDEWQKNSFARHAAAYPNVWYAVWSGTDSYNSVLSKNPGETENEVMKGGEFPVLNLHAHACSLYSATKLLGVEFNEAGVALSPDLPVDSYRLDSPLLGVAKTGAGHYEGWYAPSQPGNWKLEIKLPEQAANAITHVEVNGVASTVIKLAGGIIEITGSSDVDKSLRWALS